MIVRRRCLVVIFLLINNVTFLYIRLNTFFFQFILVMRKESLFLFEIQLFLYVFFLLLLCFILNLSYIVYLLLAYTCLFFLCYYYFCFVCVKWALFENRHQKNKITINNKNTNKRSNTHTHTHQIHISWKHGFNKRKTFTKKHEKKKTQPLEYVRWYMHTEQKKKRLDGTGRIPNGA